MASSIREITKERILNEIIRSVNPESNNGWKALVVDQESLRIISACCQMFDITEEKVTVVDKLENPRQRLANVEAIYFITPTTKSIDRLIEDFKKKGSPQYQAIHLFLTSKLPETEFKKLSNSNAVHRIKTFKEMNIEYLAIESQAFHFDQKGALYTLFSPETMNLVEEQAKMAIKLATLCVSLNEYPIIRYSNSNPVSIAVAGMTQERLDSIARTSKAFTPNEEHGTLLIIDRTIDPLAPLLHEFTYQAMIYDLFKIEGDKYSYDAVTGNGSVKKDVLLNENDYMWNGLRHKHIADVIDYLKTRLDDFLKTNQVTQYTQHVSVTKQQQQQQQQQKKKKKKQRSLKEASDVIRSLPQYQEMMSKYSLHINIAEQASQRFTEPMANLAYLEQDMATGEDAKGNTPKNIIPRLSTFLNDVMLEPADKIRLLMIYIISQEGIKEQDRKKLMDLAGIGLQDQASISNLFFLGVTLMKGAKGKQKTQVTKQRKQDEGNNPYEVSRYVPLLKDIAENLVNNTLPDSDFPYVKEKPTVSSNNQPTSKVSLKGKSNQPRWADPAAQKEEIKYSGPKLILFVLGGMSYSEMRSIYELAAYYKRNIYIGSNAILLPNEYTNDVKSLKRTENV
ncbi:Sec1-like family protein [Heterostelium album PN500]|uniref:Sec1-like family protein n=1 Tax=Heterostelium pallidum (strain ATCC 26659 / Pp 5 / PN500) TaxID=670386 RepID=D3B367_HETP5|nr:Sec1-like family protein [Heterostelium album PN500]EFA83765.1 Sec1-like family protein [Heterostelium album PN500]|eukprot:XP_020435882.1 Sec1-like family protein [Heterostelium album PN500]